MRNTKARGSQRQSRADVLRLRERAEATSGRVLAKALLAGPSRPWTGEPGGKGGLSYTVQFGVKEGEEARVRSLVGEDPILDLRGELTGDLAVLHTSSSTRIECRGRGVLGSNYTVVRTKKQGSLYLDHDTKTFLPLAEETLLGRRFKEQHSSRTEVSGDTVIVHVLRPYRFRYEIEVNRDKRYQPFSEEMTCTVLGCPEKFLEAGVDFGPVTRLGVPVRGRIYLVSPGEKDRLLSSFAVGGLKVVRTSASDFSVPKGYRDLRRTSHEGRKPTSFGPSVRLSALRPNLTRPTYDWDIPGFRPPDDGREPKGDGTRATPTDFKADRFKFPTCFQETYGSLIANVVDQKLLDDARFLVNGATKRLSGFSGTGGLINIDWMAQVKTHSDALGELDPGGGLYRMLHDENPMGPGHTQKVGLLDRLAVSTLGKLLQDGNTLADLGLPPALQARVAAVLADGSIAAADRFASFALEEQGQLIDAHVFQGIGTLRLTYPASTGTQRIFFDLLNVRLDNITFDVRINNTPVLTTLAFDADSVHLVADLPNVTGRAFLTRWPTDTYWIAVGASSAACFFFPPACALSATLVAVGLFIGMDFSFVTISLANLQVDAHIRLVPNASNVLQPSVQLTLDADVSATYTSFVPTGVHQILARIYTIVLNQTNVVMSLLQGQLQSKLNSFLTNDLAISYPPAFGPVPLTGIANSVQFVANDRGYVEQALDAGTLGVISPYITQVDGEVRSKILALRSNFRIDFIDPVAQYNSGGLLFGWASTDFRTVARYYLGTVLSQNFINHFVYTLWRTHRFNYEFTPEECGRLYEQLKVAFPAFRTVTFDEAEMRAHLWPAVPPRTVFTPKPASEKDYYSTTFFDDVRICMTFRKKKGGRIPEKMEFLFAAQAFTEIGFGGFNADTGQLDLLKVSDRLFDIYFDLKELGVRVIHPEIQSFIVPGMPVRVDLDYSALDVPELTSMFADATRYSLANRNRAFIPRGPGDPMYLQRYPLGNDALQAVFQLVPFQGNLYVSKGVSGPATAIFEGALNIDTLDKSTASLILLFV